jgi:methionine synthase II (cobalamin-independent)
LPDKLIRWLPKGAATLVGSLPHRDRERALSLVLGEMVEIPVWPQLSTYHMEQMMVQFTEGLPGLSRRDGSSFFATTDSRFEQELLGFYEEYLAVTAGELSLEQSRFRLTDETGKTFFAFLERLGQQRPPALAAKGQIVGPFTLLAGLRDEHDRLALYDSRLRDVVVKTLALKAQWQTEQLRHFAPVALVSIDEPALAGFGSSAFISVSADDVTTLLQEVASHIHIAGGLAGVHVCANTDWSLFFDGSLDFINFDAYTYFDRFALYRSSLSAYINKGGRVAWGLVPTLDEKAIVNENVDSLVRRWRNQVAQLVGPDLTLETLSHHSLITPSCGCGTLSEPLAERVVRLTRQVSARLRQEF